MCRGPVLVFSASKGEADCWDYQLSNGLGWVALAEAPAAEHGTTRNQPHLAIEQDPNFAKTGFAARLLFWQLVWSVNRLGSFIAQMH